MIKRTNELDLDLACSGHRTKADYAYLQLRRWIQTGALEAEQRLEQEELAGRLGVSRVPLRQALVRLQADGLVVGRPHVGATVATLSLEHAEDVYAGRCALEPMLTQVAVPRLTDEVVRELREFCSEQERALDDGKRELFLSLDRRFHRRLYEISGYETSATLVERLRDLSDRYVAAFQGDAERSRRTLQEHREIVSVCAAREVAAAGRLVKEHIQHGIAFLRQMSGKAETRTARQN